MFALANERQHRVYSIEYAVQYSIVYRLHEKKNVCEFNVNVRSVRLGCAGSVTYSFRGLDNRPLLL